LEVELLALEQNDTLTNWRISCASVLLWIY